MRIKLNNTDTNRLLWRDSPCTLRNVLQNPSMDHALRFHYGSIYFKDEVNKPKKIFTQFEKPQLLLMNFRRQIDEVTLRAKKAASKKTDPNSSNRDKKSVSKRSTFVIDSRFYQKPSKLELKHDRHGNRSSHAGEYDIKDLSERLKETKRNFYSSQRIDLSKPDNFWPGPGTYFNESSATQEKRFRHTFTERNRSNRQESVQNKK